MAAAHGAEIELAYDHRYSVLINEPDQCDIALSTARDNVEIFCRKYPPYQTIQSRHIDDWRQLLGPTGRNRVEITLDRMPIYGIFTFSVDR